MDISSCHDESDYVVVETSDGSTVEGWYIDESPSTVTLLTCTDSNCRVRETVMLGSSSSMTHIPPSNLVPSDLDVALSYVAVEFHDGDIVEGVLLHEDDAFIRLLVSNGDTLTVNKLDFCSIEHLPWNLTDSEIMLRSKAAELLNI